MLACNETVVSLLKHPQSREVGVVNKKILFYNNFPHTDNRTHQFTINIEY